MGDRQRCEFIGGPRDGEVEYLNDNEIVCATVIADQPDAEPHIYVRLKNKFYHESLAARLGIDSDFEGTDV